MTLLGNVLQIAGHHEESLSVREAELAMMRRPGGSEESILVAQENLAVTYSMLGRDEEALQMQRDVYAGRVRLNGEEHGATLGSALNYASSSIDLKRFEEAKSLLRKIMPVARRVLGESNETALRMRWVYANSLCNAAATLDDLREAVTTLEDTERTARRALGGAHPTTAGMGEAMRYARAALNAREDPPIQPMKINNAIAYVTTIKKRFEHQPET